MIGFIPFPRVLVLCEMRSASSMIWARVGVSISHDDSHYTTGTSQLFFVMVMHESRFVRDPALPFITIKWLHSKFNLMRNRINIILFGKIWIPFSFQLWVEKYSNWFLQGWLWHKITHEVFYAIKQRKHIKSWSPDNISDIEMRRQSGTNRQGDEELFDLINSSLYLRSQTRRFKRSINLRKKHGWTKIK